MFQHILFVAIVAAVSGFGAGTDATSSKRAGPVPGKALANTDLRLVVAGNPPLAVDVDSRRVSTINVPGRQSDVAPPSVVRLRDAAALIGSVECADCGRNQAVFLVRPGGQDATPLARALHVAPDESGGGWLLRSDRSARCEIERFSANGETQSARQSRCAWELAGQTPPGLILNRSLLEDPMTGRVLLRASGMRAVSGAQVLRAPVQRRLLLHDFRRRTAKRLRWPSAFAFTQGAVVRPNSRQIAVWFISGPVDQHIDVWLLSVATRTFNHVPGFPLAAELKRTSLTWSADGRLVILTRVKGGDALIVWRPGERQPASGFLELPPSRAAGAQTLVAW